jgi:tetratricopeptide (TPR) repeat protein
LNTRPTAEDSITGDCSPDALPHQGALGGEQLYSPAMLAEIIGISVRLVRRWYRAGLLRATTEVMHLPYFDFSELATARRLARWMQQGATVQSILRQLEMLRERAADSSSAELVSIQNLPITAEGKRLVLRTGNQFLEASGQFRFGFEQADEAGLECCPPATLLFERPACSPLGRIGSKPRVAHARDSDGERVYSLEAMIDEAITAEDEDDLPAAIDWYRAALAAYGSNADICFQLAELLYRDGDLSGARERYYMALELEPSLVEARANLGCVLAECGQSDLAVAAFEGTLEQFADYADVHFHLARSLDDLGQTERAAEHWKKFIDLAPASPWAEEAEARLRQISPLLEFDP